MIEAYEIGIKLALQDGVSDGIAAIRRDLGSFDQAIARTALRLGALQRIGVQALAASQGQAEQAAPGPLPRRPAVVAVAPPPSPESGSVVVPQPLGEPQAVAAPPPVKALPVGPARAPSARVPASAPALPATVRTAVEDAGPASSPVSSRPAVGAAPTAIRPAAPVVESAQVVVAPRRQEPLPVAPAPRAVPPREPAAVASDAKPAAPGPRATGFVTPAGERPAGRVLLPAAAPSVVSQGVETRRLAAPLAPTEPRARETTRLADAPPREAREGRLERPAVTQGMPAMRMSPEPARMAALAPPASPAVARQAPSYAPPVASTRAKEGSMQGDVFLDGVRVGRWMSEQMARDAGRPNTGPTGFDPRRSAAWPGAAVTW